MLFDSGWKMTTIVRKPDTLEKLNILSADAQYDLACACGSKKDEHRRRGANNIAETLVDHTGLRAGLGCRLRE